MERVRNYGGSTLLDRSHDSKRSLIEAMEDLNLRPPGPEPDSKSD